MADLAHGFQWRHKDLELIGYSLAGISTSLAFPAADVCFDVAQGLPFQVPIRHILITHGHLDHAGGLPYLLGQKAMLRVPPAQVHMPLALVDPMQKIMKLWEQIEGHAYTYQLNGVGPGDEVSLKEPYFAKAFPTWHRVSSVGYLIYARKKRLKLEFHGLEPRELGRLRRQGEVLDEPYNDPVLAFTGDTRIEFLDDPEVRRARVLVMEVTYWDERRPVASAREWGHIHLDELLPRLKDVQSEKIVLIHTSARYRLPELQAILARRLRPEDQARVEIFPRPI